MNPSIAYQQFPQKRYITYGRTNMNCIHNNKINNIVDINDIINKQCLSTWFEFIRGNLIDIVFVHRLSTCFEFLMGNLVDIVVIHC